MTFELSRNEIIVLLQSLANSLSLDEGDFYRRKGIVDFTFVGKGDISKIYFKESFLNEKTDLELATFYKAFKKLHRL